MKEYYRLVIDSLKNAISEYVASGEIDTTTLAEARKKLDLAIDEGFVSNQPTEDLAALREDLAWLQFDLFNE